MRRPPNSLFNSSAAVLDAHSKAATGTHLPPTANIRPRPEVSLHFIGNEGALFDPVSQRLYGLNTTATYIWICLQEGMPPTVVAERLHATFGTPRSQSEQQVSEISRSWCAAGLIAGARGRETRAQSRMCNGIAEPPTRGSEFSTGHRIAAERLYRLLDSTFRFRFSCLDAARAVNRALALPAAEPTRSRAIAVDLMAAKSAFMIFADGERLDQCARRDQLVPMVKACLAELTLRHSHDLLAVHAAAVSRDSHCLLLPGPSGSGKSTLSAALVAAGFGLLGDDSIVLARDTLDARPMPIPICVKEGSWQLLASRFPELQRLPIHLRGDGKRVRYLMPPTPGLRTDPAARLRVNRIIFPRRTNGASGHLAALSKPEALRRLAQGICPLGDGLDAAKVEQIVRWVDGIACLELSYASLDDAVRVLVELCA